MAIGKGGFGMIKAIYPIIGNSRTLPFYLTGVGKNSPEYNVKRENGLVSHQFLFTSGGKGILTVGGRSYIQTEGSLFYLSPSVPHEYRPEKDEWETCWAVFRGEHLSELMRIMGFGDFAVKNGAVNDRIVRIFEQLYAAAGDSVYGAQRCSLLVYEYILAVSEQLLSGHENTVSEQLSGAVSYIDKHLSDDITLECLAEISGVSLQHFCRLFKAALGMRPMEYIARKRVAKAKLMLCNSGEPIAEIGEKCGYRDPAYFGLVFRKYEGISPSEYRRLGGSIRY
jgi:AraC-like DNA-binding protein